MDSLLSDEKQSFSQSEMLTFRVHFAVGIFGAVSLLIAFASSFVPDQTGRIILMFLFGVMGLPLALEYLVSRIILDAEKITHRNLIGIKRKISWQNILAVYTTSWQGDAMIVSKRQKIKLHSYYRDFELIDAVIYKFVPDAYDPEAVITSRRAISNCQIVRFGKKKIIGSIGVLVAAFFLFVMFHSDLLKETISVSQLLMLGMLFAPSIYLILTCFIARVYIDDVAIVFYNAIGLRKKLLWQDIKVAYSDCFLGCDRFVVTDNKTSIRFDRSFADYELLQYLILKRSPKRIKRKPPVKRPK